MVALTDFAFGLEYAASGSPRSSFGTAAPDATSQAPASGAARTTMTWTMTIATTATLLDVITTYAGGGSITTTSVTANGTPLSRVVRATSSGNANNRLTDLWSLVNPPTGVGVTIVVTQSGSNDCDASAISWTGTDTVTPHGTPVTVGAATGTSASLGTVTGAYVLAAGAVRSTTTLTATGTPTTILNRITGAFANEANAVVYKATSLAAGFTWSVSGENAAFAIPVNSGASYTDITAFLRVADGITASRGRSDELTVLASPGRCDLALRNNDGRFTPGNGSSPYAPVQIRRPMRLKVTYTATTYPLWQGFVDDWGNGADSNYGIARVSLSDRLARSGRAKFTSALDAEILSDSPLLYYPLSEANGATAAVNAVGSGGALRFATSDSSAAADFGFGSVGPEKQTQVAVTPTAATGMGRYLAGDPVPAGTPQSGTIEAVIYCTGVTTSSVVVNTAAVAMNMFGIGVSTSGAPMAFFSGEGLVYTFASATSPDLAIGRLLHVAARYTITGAMIVIDLFVNGVLVVTTGATSMPYWTPTTSMVIGNWKTTAATGFASGFNGRVSNVAYYQRALPDARIADHAAGAISSWNGEATTDRFNRLCRVAGLPAGSYATVAASTIAMSPQPLAGKSLQDAVVEVASVENGVAYLDRNGILTFAPRTVRYRASSAITLDATKPGHVNADARTVTNDAFLLNDFTATPASGTAFRYADATSVTAYDTASDAITLLARNDDTASGLAEWRVLSFKDPRARFDGVFEVDVVAYANGGGNVAALLTTDIGSKATLTNMPTHMAPTGSMALFVEGITPVITKDAFKLRFNTSPVALEDSTFIAGDATFGVIGAGYPIPY